ncbi:MAG: LLM class F420-dependent oxidoreductase [Gammaproteobacteria bacterium]|nr:LLM class F420-dependent oxidoreductase [Gammaproteobacteria bacterium]
MRNRPVGMIGHFEPDETEEKTMKIGVSMAFNHITPPAFIGEAAQMVEAAGFDAIWVPEHVIFFPEYESRYPYSANGRIPGEPEGILDPFAALTYIAAHTKRVRLGTGICLVPQRNPVYTARMVADLDYLSSGRVDFGVGIGWLKEEFDNLQMDFGTRARRTVEYIEVMRALWSPGLAAYEGETYQLAPCQFNPKPVQSPHPPIFFGGESEPALRRVASHGDGWYGFNLSPEAFAERLSRLDALLAEAGRSRADVQVYVGPRRDLLNPDAIAQFKALGADQAIVPLMAAKLETLKPRIDGLLKAVGRFS